MSTPNESVHPRRSRRWTSLSLVLALALLSIGAAAPPQPETETVLVALRVNGELLSDSMEAAAAGDAVRLPLGELARLLELDVVIDARAPRITIARREAVFQPWRMTASGDDILVDSALIADWFSLSVKYDAHASTVKIESAKPLPYQLRRAREQEAEKALARKTAAALPRIPNPYSLFGGPFVDARLRLIGGPAPATDYDVFATGDLAGFGATAFFSGTAHHPLGESWLTLARRNPDPVLLGPLHARAVEAGEIFFPGDDLVSLARRDIGASISSFALDRSEQFDQQTISGELRPGEDVTLFANEELAGYARGSESGGHYTFPNVPVHYGLNVFRLVFHDAQGTREETRTYDVGETLIRKGTFAYRLTAGRRQLAEIAYGATRTVTMTASATSIELFDGSRHQYAGGGVRATLRRVFAFGDVMRDFHGGTIERAGFQTGVGNFRLSASRAQLQSFASEIYRPDLGAIKARTSFAVATVLGHRYSVPIRFDAAVDDLANGGRITRLRSTISSALGRTWITSSTDATLFRNVPRAAQADSTTGTLRFSRFSSNLAFRGEVGYEAKPKREMTSATFSVDWHNGRGIDVDAAVDRNLTNPAWRRTVTVRRDSGRYGIAVTLESRSQSKPVVRVELSTSLLRNPLAHRFAVESRPSASGGAVAARVYLDKNDNGVRDDGEPPIAGAGFYVNKGTSPVVTDADGHAFLDRLPADRNNEVVLSPTTLADPGWTPSRPGAAFVARAGKPLVVDFPVVVNGEISGFVRQDDHPARSVRVELVRGDGSIAATTTTLHDGFYEFSGVRPGAYTVRAAGVTRAVTISAEHTFENGDLVLH